VGIAHRLAARRRSLLRYERALWERGVMRIAGVDEVGVGPLAGPLVAAAVILPPEIGLRGVDDSKKLSPAVRERLSGELRGCALAIGVGIVTVDEVDRLNTFWASLLAMRRAVLALPLSPEHLLVDGRHIPDVDLPQERLIKGDSRSYSIAAASIVAKVERDTMMHAFDLDYPQYGFAHHMGYGTPEHLAALNQHGPCPIHRRSFVPVSQARLPGM